MAILCSFVLLATLVGLAHHERSPLVVQIDALHAQPVLPDTPCGGGSGHGACQLVVAGGPLLFSLMTVVGSSRFKITPVLASSRSIGPHTPPPRRFS